MQDCVKEVRDLESSYEDINALIELTEEEEDREMIKEIQREIAKFEKEFEDLTLDLFDHLPVFFLFRKFDQCIDIFI